MRILLWTALLALTGCASTTFINGVPNLAAVSPGIYRGGQPTHGGWRYLKSIGVTNVIKLNEEKEGSDDYARVIGMTITTFPISLRQQIGMSALDLDYVWVIDEFGVPLNLPTQQGLYIHCEHGQDRTGLFVAIYRWKIQHWSKGDAEMEMLAHGFHKALHGLWEFWENLK